MNMPSGQNSPNSEVCEFEGKVKSNAIAVVANTFVSFTIDVGPMGAGTGTLRFIITQEGGGPLFPSMPRQVFVQTKQGRDFGWPEWSDVFATNIAGYDQSKVWVKIRRVDGANGGGWAMQLQLQVLAVL